MTIFYQNSRKLYEGPFWGHFCHCQGNHEFFGKPTSIAVKKTLMVPFYGWGSTASRLEPFRRGSLLFTIKFPEIPCAHLIDLGRMKDWVDLRRKLRCSEKSWLQMYVQTDGQANGKTNSQNISFRGFKNPTRGIILRYKDLLQGARGPTNTRRWLIHAKEVSIKT